MDGFSQNVNEPAHLFNHTLDLFVTCSIETEQLRVFPENPLFLFHFTGVDYTALENKFHYTSCLSESAVTRFNRVILHIVFFDAVCRHNAEQRGRGAC